jgi:GNAT superfamily N-acetyltransferase
MAGVSQPGADRSVRVAWVADAPALGSVQARAWRAACAGLLPAAALEDLQPDALAAVWAESIRRPPSARHRVLVALERATVVGLAALAPSEDADADALVDAELLTLAVDPDHVDAGHGSRLLAAVADTARADGFTRLSTWVLAADDGWLAFLQSGGWAADGAHRELSSDEDDATARQVRLHTSLEPG